MLLSFQDHPYPHQPINMSYLNYIKKKEACTFFALLKDYMLLTHNNFIDHQNKFL